MATMANGRVSPGLAGYLFHAGSYLTSVASKILISEKLSNYSCSGMYLNGFTVTFRVEVVSQFISRANAKNCSGFPPLLDSGCLRSRIA